MLKYINKMGAVHWLLLSVGLLALFSLGKLVAGFMTLVAIIACLVRWWGKISSGFNLLFKKEE